MYDVILKWGLETVQKAVIAKHDSNVEVIIEAMRVRNDIVLKRYDHAYNACEALLDLIIQIEKDLEAFRKEICGKQNNVSRSDFLKVLESDFHPQRLQTYRKLRSKFETTNDLLSGYSLETGHLISFKTFKSICIEQERPRYDDKVAKLEAIYSGQELEDKKKEIDVYPKISDTCSLYRAIWTHLSGILSAALRISSNDLRFWLTDEPYVRLAEDCARKESDFAKDYFMRKQHKTYGFLLEKQENIEHFWNGDINSMVSTY